MMIDLTDKPERALLVAVDIEQQDVYWTFEDEQDEFSALVKSTGLEIAENIRVPRDKPDPAYFIGTGKVNEIKEYCSGEEIDVIIFNKELSPKQQRNLEDKIDIKVIDRTQLVLDIFASHAKTQQGMLQVELAQLEYALPRLAGKFSAMMRQKGGIGLRGPGETKLEVDRRRIQDKIAYIKKEIKQLGVHRELLRKKRQKAARPYVALVGYTSAGKTSILNALTDAGKSTNADYFTTLDTVTRIMEVGDRDEILLADTVGFVHDLPQKLVDAFMSTLEELHEADLLLHVVDVSNAHYRKMKQAVESLLAKLDLSSKSVLYVYNKIDLLDEHARSMLDYWHPVSESVFVSAKNKEGMDMLCLEIQKRVQTSVEVKIVIQADCNDALNYIYKNSSIHSSGSQGDNGLVFELSMKRDKWTVFMEQFSDAVLEVKL